MHYVIGHPPRGSNASPVLVYAGKSGNEARQAAAADTTSAELEHLAHVAGVRKRNPNFQAEEVKIEAVEVQAEEVKTETKRGRK